MNIYIERAYREYNGARVLDIDQMRFEEGYIYAVLGLNGSGKSTLLECIAGLNHFSGGKIIYNDGLCIDSVRQNISMMLQKTYLFNSTVLENIECSLKFRKKAVDQISEVVNKYLSYFDMGNLLYKNARKLSGGEAAKTALLRTVVLEAELIMLDEPTASMDIESTINAERLIKDMSGGSRTIILVTHDPYQAERIADYIIFMDKGRVIESGKKHRVLNHPEHKIVKQMLNI